MIRVLTLALDAATYTGSVAVLDGTRVLAERDTAMRGKHEERLMPAVSAALDAAQVPADALARVVCGAGPGSFTSLRIAAAIAKGIAAALALPLVPVPSLALIVAARDELPPGRYLAVLDALRREAYAALCERAVDGAVTLLEPARLVARDELDALARERHARTIGPAESCEALPHARGVARLQELLAVTPTADLASWEPTYGRPAEAQRRWERAHARALRAE